MKLNPRTQRMKSRPLMLLKRRLPLSLLLSKVPNLHLKSRSRKFLETQSKSLPSPKGNSRRNARRDPAMVAARTLQASWSTVPRKPQLTRPSKTPLTPHKPGTRSPKSRRKFLRPRPKPTLLPTRCSTLRSPPKLTRLRRKIWPLHSSLLTTSSRIRLLMTKSRPRLTQTRQLSTTWE